MLRTQKNRENGITIYIKTLRVFFLHSSVFSFHLLCPSLSKYRPEVLFLSPSRPANHHHCRPASASPGHHFCSPFNPRAQPPSPVKKTEQPRRQPYRPVTSDAHSGHHLRRHHDQKNHLGVLYPKVLTGKPFITLENLVHHCSSSSFLHAGGVNSFTPLPTIPTRGQWVGGAGFVPGLTL